MTDIVERLRRYKRDRSGYAVHCHQAADEIERLRGQLEAQKNEWLSWDEKRKELERDAARYRWLKTRKASDWEFFGWRTDTDAAIDAAMRG